MCASLTVDMIMTRLFNLVKVKKDSARPFSPLQKAKFVSSKVVNAGKSRYSGNNVLSKL